MTCGVVLRHDVIANTKLFNPENRVYVQATGDIEWFTAGVLTTSCNLDLTLYPFDNQTCFLHIEALVQSRQQWFIHTIFCYTDNTENNYKLKRLSKTLLYKQLAIISSLT